MNPEFLRYYSEELRYLREMGGEFAAAYPKIAGRLGLESFECADPYVERMLEGFSFLAARTRMRLEAEFPRFTRHLAEMIYPRFLAPTPSMAVIQFQPEWGHPALARGYRVARGTSLKSHLDKFGTTRCEYRTAHDVTLWPLRLDAAEYTPYMGGINGARMDNGRRPEAMLRLRFSLPGGIPARSLAMDKLALFLRGADALPSRLYELLVGHVIQGWLSAPAASPATAGTGTAARGWLVPLGEGCVTAAGLSDQEALLPPSRQAFRGYRLLQEYFAFPERYLFVELHGLADALRGRDGSAFDVVLLLDNHDPHLDRVVGPSNFCLNCTPAINLFPCRSDRLILDPGKFEFHVVPDRSRPIDLEIHGVEAAHGYGASDTPPRTFEPFFRVRDPEAQRRGGGGFFQLRREPRRATQRELRDGPRSRYLGSDVFIALLDMDAAPLGDDIRQLGIDAWCTNRDLPLSMPVGVGATDFFFDDEMPVRSIRCVAGPSEPRPGMTANASTWRLLNHLALNHRSLFDDDGADGCGIRELLDLYCHETDVVGRRQISGIAGVRSRGITRRLPMPGRAAFGRGLEVTLTLDDGAFQGGGAFLLSAVLQAFFAGYVSINHFAETLVRTPARGEIMRWAGKEGLCHML
ncbi:type VI secretion system protein ImpG [Bordetella genomosp. 8]|uniref:Type VI secretion system protein ImpG n=1 Tax=Bordetella genomosp. 8 TaxID=1416806 RepID=A0A1W6YQQ8_9BORD|nr:type VI secretion system baseplate subunit TssF [Bordetella genomosp. 8]ARP83348.1 type VI secretion system protein ImpG [Bordetella genomosp. 8]